MLATPAHHGCGRASRPPPLQHRVPMPAWGAACATSAGRRL